MRKRLADEKRGLTSALTLVKRESHTGDESKADFTTFVQGAQVPYTCVRSRCPIVRHSHNPDAQDRLEAAARTFAEAMQDFAALLRYFGEKPDMTFATFFSTLLEFSQVSSTCMHRPMLPLTFVARRVSVVSASGARERAARSRCAPRERTGSQEEG